MEKNKVGWSKIKLGEENKIRWSKIYNMITKIRLENGMDNTSKIMMTMMVLICIVDDDDGDCNMLSDGAISAWPDWHYVC